MLIHTQTYTEREGRFTFIIVFLFPAAVHSSLPMPGFWPAWTSTFTSGWRKDRPLVQRLRIYLRTVARQVSPRFSREDARNIMVNIAPEPILGLSCREVFGWVGGLGVVMDKACLYICGLRRIYIFILQRGLNPIGSD